MYGIVGLRAATRPLSLPRAAFSLPLRRLLSQPPLDRRAQIGQKILDKVPRFLKPYTVNFINNPFTNLTAFVILHELSAIVPLVGLWYLFHNYSFLMPDTLSLPDYAIEKGTKIIEKSLQSFNFETYSLADKVKLIMEGAYAYVIVKALLPVRLVVSFGLTPFFSKYFLLPVQRVFRKKQVAPAAPPEPQVKVKPISKPRL